MSVLDLTTIVNDCFGIHGDGSPAVRLDSFGGDPVVEPAPKTGPAVDPAPGT